jgi:hypothetical protein
MCLTTIPQPRVRLGPDRSREKNIIQSSDSVQKDLDTLSQAHANLHARRPEIHLQIDDDAAGKRSIHLNGQTSIARVLWPCKADVAAEIDDGICGE